MTNKTRTNKTRKFRGGGRTAKNAKTLTAVKKNTNAKTTSKRSKYGITSYPKNYLSKKSRLSEYVDREIHRKILFKVSRERLPVSVYHDLIVKYNIIRDKATDKKDYPDIVQLLRNLSEKSDEMAVKNDIAIILKGF